MEKGKLSDGWGEDTVFDQRLLTKEINMNCQIITISIVDTFLVLHTVSNSPILL